MVLLYRHWTKLVDALPPHYKFCLVELHDQELRHLGVDPWYCHSSLISASGLYGGWILKNGVILDSHPEDLWTLAEVEMVKAILTRCA